MTKKEVQEKIEELIDNIEYWISEEDRHKSINEFKSLISDVNKYIIGENEKEGKHDTCEVDGDDWCYSHNEAIEEGTSTTHSSRNQLRSEQEDRRKELLG